MAPAPGAAPDDQSTVPTAVILAPGGQAVDGRRLVGEAVGFGRALRAGGLAVDLGAAIDFSRALTLVDVGDREQVRAAGEAVFVRRRDDRIVYDRIFERWWRRRAARLPSDGPALPPLEDEGLDAGADGTDTGAADDDHAAGEPLGQLLAAAGEDGDEAVTPDRTVIAPDAFSTAEALRHREFDRMTAAELRDAERLVDLLKPHLEQRRTRRHELHRHGRYLAPRAMYRRNLATGGDLTEWVWRRPTRRPRPIVVLCDISGSMERHSRLLLRFVQALSAASIVRTESFVFGTRLTRVTRQLRDRDRDRALANVADAVEDWAGGTRIGASFRDFNLKWARRTLRSSGVVIVVSDGWDRGDPALVASETARLRRNCHRLVWLNPLAGVPGYQPLAGGMQAAHPYIDDFLPAGTVASLERLGEILAGVRAGDLRRGSEAAAATDAGARSSPTAAGLAAWAARPMASTGRDTLEGDGPR
ncbi:MAG TPA: VWA domain-containing protein [Candidatus Limnocylindrales bacterium]